MKYSVSIILFLLISVFCHASPKLTGDTGNPYNSMFKRGDVVALSFNASGLKPNETISLELNIVDQNDRSVKKIKIPVKADSTGKWSGNINGPNSEYGFYRVKAKLSDGTTLPKLGSRPKGCLTYAVLPDPNSRKVYPIDETFFGIHGTPSKKADIAAWIGGHWQSRGVCKTQDDVQKRIEKKKNSLYPNWVDYTYVAYVHSSCPYTFWRKELLDKHTTGYKGRISVKTRFSDAEGKKLYIAANAQLAKYGLLYLGDNDTARYEPLWEPDLYMTNENILEIYKAARQGLHSVDPKALLLGPCFHSITEGSVLRMRELFKLGFLDYIDEFTIHPYIQYPVEQNGLVENIRLLKRYIKEYAKGREIKIRANESGYSAQNNVTHELIQMYGQVRASLIMLGEGFACNEPFYGYDCNSNCTGDYGVTYNLMMPKQIWGPTLVSPRPVFPALSAVSYILEGHKSTGVIDYLGDTVLGYSYADREDHCVVALWDFGGKTPKVEIPVGQREIEIADIMGNRRKVMPSDGSVTLKLSESPIYLVGVSPKLWGRNAVRHINVKNRELSAIVGRTAKLEGKLDVDGKVRLDFGPMNVKSMTASVRKGEPFTFEFNIPKMLTAGRYPLTLKLLDQGKVTEAKGIILEVKPPVKIDSIRPAFVRGAPALTLTLSDLSGKEEKGIVETRIPGYPDARKRYKFTLNPTETKDITIEFDELDISPFEMINAQIKIVLSSQYVLESSKKINFLPAVYLPKVGIDNNFSHNQKLKYYPVGSNVIRGNYYYKGTEDVNASVAFGWNEQYLLFDILVEDDVFFQPFSGWKIWDGDSVQLGFAKQSSCPNTANEFGEKSQLAFSEINFALTKNGAEADRAHTYDERSFPKRSVSLKDCPRKITQKTIDGKSTIHYQIAVPWRFMNISKAEAGMNVFWAAMINDRDQPRPKQRDITALGVFNLKQAPPKNFGAIVLTQ